MKDYLQVAKHTLELKLPEEPAGDPYRLAYPTVRPEASPSHGMCCKCGAEWGLARPGRPLHEWHHMSCPSHGVSTSASSWSACPCGKPAPPEGETRHSLYRGDELVEVHYPHGDGTTCCWTREMRR